VLLAIGHRSLLENLRAYPWSFLAARLFGSFFTIALAYLIHRALFSNQTPASFQIYAGSSDYLTFILIGVSISTYANGALLGVGRSLIGERRTGTIESLFLAPIPLTAYLVGVMVQQAVLTTIDFLVILVIGVSFGANLAGVNWLGLIVTLIVGHIGFFGMAVILSAVMLYLRDTYVTQNTVIALLYLISGVLFPIQYLPGWVQPVSSIIPLTQALILARRSALLGHSLLSQLPDLLSLLALSLLYCTIGLFLVGKVRRVALEVALS
jgi:ABC-2 type transport system permease protein